MDMTTIDRVLAFGGFLLTLWQLHRTRTAAQAAREAADQAISAIRRLEAATDMHDISSRSRELLRLLRSQSLEPAAAAAFELRDTVARYRHDEQSKLIVSAEVWSQAIADVGELHDRLESFSALASIGPRNWEALLHKVAELHTLFASLAAQAGTKGATDANTD